MNSRSLTVPVIFLIFIFSGISSFAQQYNASSLSNIAGSEQLYKSKLYSAKKTRATASTDIHIKYARLLWYVDPAKDTIAGTITYLFSTLSAVDTLKFDMNDTLVNDSVYYHNANVVFTHTSNVLKVALPTSLPVNTVDSITIYYHGNPSEANGFGSFTTTVHNDTVPIMWTLSEPYGASEWWPCKNDLTDKIDSCSIAMITPNAYIASANGHIDSQSTDGFNNYFYFSMHYPVATYLIGIAATDYEYFDTTITLTHGSVLVTHETYPDSYNAFQSTAPSLYSALFFYDSIFGKYPFMKDRFGQTQFSWGGGMEHQTNTFVTYNSYELDVHEMAHQWFGDKITCGSWHDIWLNEGWATYSSGLCYEHFFKNQYWIPFKSGRINNIVSQPAGSVWVDDTTSVDRIFDSRLSYAKGAMVLNMLRWEIGDSAFFNGVRYYLNDTDVCYKFARTLQFQQDLARFAGQNLDTFFNEWYTGQGYPTYTITSNQTGNYITLHINQAVSDSSATKLFYMHLPITLKSSTGADTLLRVWNDSASQTYTVHVPFTVDSVLFDPQYDIVAGNHKLTTSVHDIIDAATANLQVYPNPANNQLYIAHSIACNKLRVYNVLGQLVMEHNINTGNILDVLNLQSLTPGVYIVQLQKTDGTRLVQQFVKQ